MTSEAEIAWAAGLFEGEGTIAAKRGKGMAHRYQAAVIMTDKDVLERFAATVGMGKFYGPYQPTNQKAKPIWRWMTTRNREIAELCELIGPWLGARRSARFEHAIADIRANPAKVVFHKLSSEIHSEIRLRYAAGGITQAALGAEFGIHQGMVSIICRRRDADQPLPIDVPLLNKK
jgi:hypothetical protein